jgi:hypothetical protein
MGNRWGFTRIRRSKGTIGTRTVRLDEESEETLECLRHLAGLSISQVLEREFAGLQQECRRPYGIYHELDLGAGDYAVAPARQPKAAVADHARCATRLARIEEPMDCGKGIGITGSNCSLDPLRTYPARG